jgi:hypothetical protein
VAKSVGNSPRDLLKQQAEAAAEALRAGADVAPERVERLQRLQRVVEIYDATHPAPRSRWPVAAVFLTTLIGCSVLLFVRRGETDIRLDLAVSEVAFGLPAAQKLTELTPLTTLGALGMREIQLPRARDRAARSLHSADEAVPPARLAQAAEGKRQGSITLETIILPANTHLRIHSEGAPSLRLSLQRAETDLQASVYGPIEVAVAGEGPQRLDIASPQPVLFRPATSEADLDLSLAGPGKSVFAVPLRADSLSFIQVDQAGDEARSIVRRTSTILSGTLYFESLNGEERKLRPGEMLELSRARGEITELRVEPDHLALRYQGRVEGLTIGAGGSQRSLMPTWLDWLKARRGAWLLWGTAVYLFGLVMGFLRWLGKSP